MDISNLISSRDADDRVNRVTSPEEAIKLYTTAERSGDIELGFAVKRKARALGWDLTGTTKGSLAREIHEAMTDLVELHKRIGQSVRNTLDAGSISHDYAATQIAKFNYVDKLNAIAARANKNLEVANTGYDNAMSRLTTPTGNTQEQLLAEIRAGRTWERIKLELSTAGSTADALNAASTRLSTGTPDEKAVILSEAPSYFAALGIPNATDTLTATLLNSDLTIAAAHSLKTAAAKLATVVQYNTQHLSRRLASVPPSYAVEPSGTEFANLLGYVDPATVAY